MKVVVLGILFWQLAAAQTPGTFTATGSMTVPRAGHTATLLPNGKVLTAGGGSPTLELYDPSTRTFAAAGAMTASPYVRSATLLPDGRVLLIESQNAELYETFTGTIKATGSMIDQQSGTAVLLTNGKVLITGEANPELYDPSTGRFTPAGPYANAYTHEDGFQTSATLLPSGDVLFAADIQYLRNYGAELYDATTSTFRLTGAMMSVLLGRSTTLLVNGKVLRAGGADDLGRYQNAEQYDPATGIFSATGEMTTPRNGHAAVLLPDGMVLITGGGGQSNNGPYLGSLASAELHDSSTATFTATGSMTARRQYHTATLLNDGRVLITGGVDSGGIGILYGNLSSAEIYTPRALVPAPSLLSLSADGRGQGAIWHAQTAQIASAGNRVAAGDVLSLYTTSLADGSVIPPQVSVGGRLAQVLYFGAAPGYPGYYQVNFVVPDGVPSGDSVPVRLTYLGRWSNEVTVGVW